MKSFKDVKDWAAKKQAGKLSKFIKEEEEELVEHYRKYGYDCLVIWEWDCYLWGELRLRLRDWVET